MLGRVSRRSTPGYGRQLDPLQPPALGETCLPRSPSQTMKLGYAVRGSSPACSCPLLQSPAPLPTHPPGTPYALIFWELLWTSSTVITNWRRTR